jgi:hypothetical protein
VAQRRHYPGVPIRTTAARGQVRSFGLLGAPLAAVLVAVWLIADPRTPDLAAQVYRVDLFRQLGFAVWDEHWYAGHHLPGYSLLAPVLGSLLGLRLVGALSVLASVLLFERIALAAYGPRARLGVALFALAAVGDVWIGRLAFALGVPLALAAVLALMRGRPRAAAALAALCAAASPVAGALLVLAGLTDALSRRSPRMLAALAAPVAVVLIPLALLFPEGGFEPYPFLSFVATVLVVLAFLLALGPGQRLLRVGGLVYLAACLASLLVRTPMGSNIERYGVLLAGPLLLCARLGAPGARSGGDRGGGRGSSELLSAGVRRMRLGRSAGLTPMVVVALGVIAVWILWGPVRESTAVSGNDSTSASYYFPVERFLAAQPGPPPRIEVPLTRSHWEAALLAPSVSLARGWEKQLDGRFDQVLLSPGLSGPEYERWLHQQAVSYVALPDTTLDPSSAQEGRLIRRGLPFLRLVFASSHWRVYAVASPTPLAAGPGRLTALGHDSFSLRADSAGTFLVRVHYTRYWTLARGSGCVARAPGDWTSVSVTAPGQVVVAARFSLGRALGSVGPCRVLVAAAVRAPEPVRSPLYRWLVAIAGPAPSVAAENLAPGTRAWRLPGPPWLLGGAARGRIAGYVAQQSIAPGELQSVYVRAPGARAVSVSVFRMGWYGGRGGRIVLRSARLRAIRQPRCAHRLATGLTECRWHASLSFPIPGALASGVYIVKLSASTGAQSDCLFVVRSARPAPLLVEIPTATYEAYNAWGGNSLYPGGRPVGATSARRGVEVSYDRPYDSQTGAGQFFMRDVAMVRFLERHGYPVAYTTIESIDSDPSQVLRARALMDVGHSEYWSTRDALAFARARDHGTSLLFMSSDTMAWRVRFAVATAASSQAGAADHRIVAYKESAGRDPYLAERSGLFPFGGAPLVGSAYDGCITERMGQRGPPVYRYDAWTPAPDLRPSWLFAGTGITPSTRIGGIVGYELDRRTSATPPGTLLVGGGAPWSCGHGGEPSPASGATAESTLYSVRSGALVFASGTLGWEYGLSPVPQASPDAPRFPDPRVVAMTRNLLARVLGAAAPR